MGFGNLRIATLRNDRLAISSNNMESLLQP